MSPALKRLKEIVGSAPEHLDHDAVMQRLYELVGLKKEEERPIFEERRPLLVVIGGQRERKR